eukprot:21271-Heterococcus_DN1.PRE.1
MLYTFAYCVQLQRQASSLAPHQARPVSCALLQQQQLWSSFRSAALLSSCVVQAAALWEGCAVVQGSGVLSSGAGAADKRCVSATAHCGCSDVNAMLIQRTVLALAAPVCDTIRALLPLPVL